jgi:hypothetical protein
MQRASRERLVFASATALASKRDRVSREVGYLPLENGHLYLDPKSIQVDAHLQVHIDYWKEKALQRRLILGQSWLLFTLLYQFAKHKWLIYRGMWMGSEIYS